MLDQVLPVEDHETAAVVEKSFKNSGIDCRVSTSVENIKVNAKGVKMDLVQGENSENITADSTPSDRASKYRRVVVPKSKADMESDI